MAKKNEIPDRRNLFDDLLSGPMKDSAQQVWLAGLGALAKAQQEGGRVFEALVKEGSTLQAQNPTAVGAKFAEVAARMADLAGGLAKDSAAGVGAGATPPWDRLESIFEQRVAKALARLGVPTTAEFEALARRVDALAARLDAQSGAPAKRAPRKSPAKRSAARKSA